jgi:hypothetical protein
MMTHEAVMRALENVTIGMAEKTMTVKSKMTVGHFVAHMRKVGEILPRLWRA